MPRRSKTSRYPEVYARWQRDPHGFWGEAADAIDWIEKPKTVFDPNAGVYGRWFPDGVCNTCYNAVDRHVDAGRGAQAAIIYDSPVTGTKQTITYAALQTKTEILAGILEKDFGVTKGDRVILYMPMMPEALVGDAGLRADRRGAFGGVRRLRAEGACHPHRRLHAEGHPLRELRHRGGARHCLQAAARRGDRPCRSTSPTPA